MLKDFKLWLGCLLLIIGVALTAYAGTQSKININDMTSADWQATDLKGVGTVTEGKILAAVPVSSISDIDAIDGIGDVKTATITRHFTTHDTCRYEIFMTALIIGICVSIAGILLIAAACALWVLCKIKDRNFKNSIKKSVSIIAQDRM